MKGVLIFFLLQSSNIFAQNYYTIDKTPFNKFVEEKEIEWAIYRNDSLLIDNPDLRDLLIQKAKTKKIKVFHAIEAGNVAENNIQYFFDKDYSNIGFDNTMQEPYTNDEGELTITLNKKRKLDLLEPKGELWVTQILFIKNGLLYSTINRVSPRLHVVSTSGIILGKSEYFSTALNKNYTTHFPKKDKIIYLKQTSTELFVDTIKKDNKLKEMYGHNLIETLWPYIESDKIKCFTVPENKATTINEIEKNNLLNLQTILIPMYDSIGMLAGTKLIRTEIKAAIFDKISIAQEWYYNETKNIVFCKIPFAIITVMKNNSSEGDDKSLRQIKLVF